MIARWLGALGIAGLLVVPSCATATSLKIETFSEVACDRNAPAVLLTAGTLAELAASAPSATSTRCEADGLLGSVVITPSGSKDSTIALALMTRPDGQSADTCLDPARANGCIVAKRRLRFEPHHEISMRVDLRLSCLGVSCAEGETCVRGACVGADITCEGACDETTLTTASLVSTSGGDGGDRGDDGGGAIADAGPGSDASVAFDAGGLPDGGIRTTAGSVALGLAHACVLFGTGQVGCTGNNDNGQLGDGTFTSRTKLAAVGVPPAKAIAAGDNFTCAILESGHVMCWGANNRGQLGTGASAPAVSTPAEVVGVTQADVIALGAAHGCVSIPGAGGTYRALCWGANEAGQLGNGAPNGMLTDSSVPVEATAAAGSLPLVLGAGGAHSCAGFGKTLRCWGSNTVGQLGDGTNTSSTSPVSVAISTDLGGLGLGGTNSCLVSPGGGGSHVKCWGSNEFGQLGDETTTPSNVPRGTGIVTQGSFGGDGGIVFTTLTGVDVAMGTGHACMAVFDGSLICWGQNDVGQLGDPAGAPHGPRSAPGISGVTHVFARGQGTCVTGSTGVRCFGTAAGFGL